MDNVELCKRRARQIKREHPDKSYMQRLNIIAKEIGFVDFNQLKDTKVSAVNVGTIGHVDHGKKSLSNAISKAINGIGE